MSATTRHHWPTQLRLPGQAAAAEGPIDMHAMYVMHHAFRRDLATFAEAARSTPAADRETWRALADRWELFAHILHHHHTGEDTGVWPFLMARADAGGRRTLEAMEAEHAEIDPLLRACAGAFGQLAAAADDEVRIDLANRLAAARESLGRHLAHEETEAIPLIQALITEAEWAQVEQEFFRQGVSVRRMASLVPWAAHGLSAADRDRVLRHTGRATVVMWRLTRRRFERRERRTFRCASCRGTGSPEKVEQVFE
jgi:hemerythrin-like domain-containing protein